jgi:hypothetical protein
MEACNSFNHADIPNGLARIGGYQFPPGVAHPSSFALLDNAATLLVVIPQWWPQFQVL